MFSGSAPGTSNLRKAIATRPRLQNRFFRNKTYENKSAYVKQRNYCSRLYKSERKKYYSNLDIKFLTDKRFSNLMKPFVSDKGITPNSNTVIEEDKIISSDKDVATKLNSFFADAVTTLNTNISVEYINQTVDTYDPINTIIVSFLSTLACRLKHTYVQVRT